MFTKLDDPAALPTGNGMSPVFSPNGPYLAVAHYTSPFLTIYKREGDTFTKLDGLAWPPANAGMGAAFSSDGTLLAVGHQGSPYISVYRIATALLNGLYVATQAGGAGDIIDAVELIAET